MSNSVRKATVRPSHYVLLLTYQFQNFSLRIVMVWTEEYKYLVAGQCSQSTYNTNTKDSCSKSIQPPNNAPAGCPFTKSHACMTRLLIKSEPRG